MHQPFFQRGQRGELEGGCPVSCLPSCREVGGKAELELLASQAGAVNHPGLWQQHASQLSSLQPRQFSKEEVGGESWPPARGHKMAIAPWHVSVRAQGLSAPAGSVHSAWAALLWQNGLLKHCWVSSLQPLRAVGILT